MALDAISENILRTDSAGGAGGSSAGGSSAVASANAAAAAAADGGADAGSGDGDLVDDPFGKPISAGVLCFDEVQVMDIADATIVSGVLKRLFDAGWVLVATCNRTPQEFAASILHREHPQARFTERLLEVYASAHPRR